MARYTVSPPCGGFSCEAGSASPLEDGTFEIDDSRIVDAMRAHGLTVEPVPTAEPTPAEKKAAAKAAKAAAAEAEAAEAAKAEAAAAAAAETAKIAAGSAAEAAALDAALAAAIGNDSVAGA